MDGGEGSPNHGRHKGMTSNVIAHSVVDVNYHKDIRNEIKWDISFHSPSSVTSGHARTYIDFNLPSSAKASRHASSTYGINERMNE